MFNVLTLYEILYSKCTVGDTAQNHISIIPEWDLKALDEKRAFIRSANIRIILYDVLALNKLIHCISCMHMH